MALYLTESDIAGLLDMKTTLEVLDEAFKAQGNGEVVNRSRLRIPLANGSYNLMSAGWTGKGIVGHKSYTATRNGASFHIMLYEAEGRGLLAIVEAGLLGKLRTGGATGIATRYMARKDARTVGIIGAGNQAEAQIEAVSQVIDVRQVRVYSRTEERRTDFADRMSEKLSIDIVPVDSGQAAVEGADVVVAITNSMQPVLTGESLESGQHVNAAGNNIWLGRELETEAVARFDTVVVDDIDQARIESGELMRAAEVGHFNWTSALALSDVVAGNVPGRKADSDLTLFESLGVALEDIALGERAFSLAREQGVGTDLP